MCVCVCVCKIFCEISLVLHFKTSDQAKQADVLHHSAVQHHSCVSVSGRSWTSRCGTMKRKLSSRRKPWTPTQNGCVLGPASRARLSGNVDSKRCQIGPELAFPGCFSDPRSAGAAAGRGILLSSPIPPRIQGAVSGAFGVRDVEASCPILRQRMGRQSRGRIWQNQLHSQSKQKHFCASRPAHVMLKSGPGSRPAHD